MANKKIPQFDLKLSPAAIKNANTVLKSGWINTGTKVKQFEEKLAKLSGLKYAVAFNSATSALQISLESFGVEPGDEVITTPFTFVATAASILRAGGTLVFADINPVSLNIDPNDIVKRITNNTVGIVAVDIGGCPADYRKLRKICKEYSLFLIADSAHSLTSTYRGKPTAKQADASVYSFQATKNLTSVDGGMLVTNHKRLADRARLLSQHGMTSNASQRKRLGKWEYDVSLLGMKANMSDLLASVGLGQLSVLSENQALRKRIAERYFMELSHLTEYIELPYTDKSFTHSWHLFIINLKLDHLKINRNQFINKMAKAGIECSVHYKPIFEFSYYQQIGFDPLDYPNTVEAGKAVVSLPIYPSLKLSDVEYICKEVEKICLH